MNEDFGICTQIKSTTFFDSILSKWISEIEMTQKYMDKDTQKWSEESVAVMGSSGDDFNTVKSGLEENFEAYLLSVFGDLRKDTENFYIKR